MACAPGGAPTRRRLALPLTLGLALCGWWGFLVFSLPGASDPEGGLRVWALAAQWVLTNAGLALALVCGYRLARRLGAHLASRDQAPPSERHEQPAPTGRRRRPSAAVLIVAGAALIALSELTWVVITPGTVVSPWVFGLSTAIGVVGPAAVTVGTYLAPRRLEDHLEGRRPDRASTRPPAGGAPHASGLTSPYVII